jgi:hypothetical protein
VRLVRDPPRAKGKRPIAYPAIAAPATGRARAALAGKLDSGTYYWI